MKKNPKNVIQCQQILKILNFPKNCLSEQCLYSECKNILKLQRKYLQPIETLPLSELRLINSFYWSLFATINPWPCLGIMNTIYMKFLCKIQRQCSLYKEAKGSDRNLQHLGKLFVTMLEFAHYCCLQINTHKKHLQGAWQSNHVFVRYDWCC